jgi:hypothetical protein
MSTVGALSSDSRVPWACSPIKGNENPGDFRKSEINSFRIAYYVQTFPTSAALRKLREEGIIQLTINGP